MNFLLYMLGRATWDPAGVRPTARHMVLAGAARHAADGDLAAALGAYRRLAGTRRGSALDAMIRGHLHLALEQYPQARHYFALGIERVLESGTHPPASAPVSTETALEALLTEAQAILRQGRYARATELLRKARTLIDVLLAARAGMLLAEARLNAHDSERETPPEDSVYSLVRLSDLTLRLLSRIHLTREVAVSLGQKKLREDLAPWATSAGRVQALLDAEYQRLARVAAEFPGHAESQYRVGLIARATGNWNAAAAAFRAVLALHPHHVSSAVRLAATLRELGEGDGDCVALAFDVPARTLGTFAAFAQAAGDPKALEVTAARLCDTCADDKARTITRGNLAFALGEVAEVDQVWSAWREPVGV